MTIHDRYDVYLEMGTKKAFAGALDWPGWCRAGRDADAALQALIQAGPRYARVLAASGLAFVAPASLQDLQVAARVEGNATTDFGAPDIPLASDWDPIETAELERFQAILQACWAALAEALRKAAGKSLRKGPRGGGRDQTGILLHVIGGEKNYLSRLGWPIKTVKGEPLDATLARLQGEILRGMQAANAGQLADTGPRGGKRWPARFYVRRAAWHVLDHAWEVEDRIE